MGLFAAGEPLDGHAVVLSGIRNASALLLENMYSFQSLRRALKLPASSLPIHLQAQLLLRPYFEGLPCLPDTNSKEKAHCPHWSSQLTGPGQIQHYQSLPLLCPASTPFFTLLQISFQILVRLLCKAKQVFWL